MSDDLHGMNPSDSLQRPSSTADLILLSIGEMRGLLNEEAKRMERMETAAAKTDQNIDRIREELHLHTAERRALEERVARAERFIEEWKVTRKDASTMRREILLRLLPITLGGGAMGSGVVMILLRMVGVLG
jgi:hypothetical protein